MGEALYFNGSSAKVLEGEAKLEIMDILEGGPAGFGELVEELELAKSTVSNHLSDLAGMGLVSVESDGEDARRKVVRAESSRLGSTGGKLDLEGPLRASVSSSLDGPEDFLKSVMLVLRYHAYTEGLDLDPGMRHAGRLVGSEVGAGIDASDREGLLARLSERWESLGLGKLGSSGASISFKNGFGCENIPGPGVCGFYEGFFEGVLSAGMGEDSDIVMRDCEASGSSYCRFEIR